MGREASGRSVSAVTPPGGPQRYTEQSVFRTLRDPDTHFRPHPATFAIPCLYSECAIFRFTSVARRCSTMSPS
jgi:hypothetical protein